MLTDSEIAALVGRIVARLDPQKVIVFGSYAKGMATARSDLDLFVLMNTDLPMTRRADGVRSLLSRMPVRVDVLVYTPEEVDAYSRDESSIVSTVLRTGWTVYDSGSSERSPLVNRVDDDENGSRIRVE